MLSLLVGAFSSHVVPRAPPAAIVLQQRLPSARMAMQDANIFTLEEKKDGWDDFRRDIKGRLTAWGELRRVCKPVTQPMQQAQRWALVLVRALVLSTNRLTIPQKKANTVEREPYPLETHWTSTMAEELEEAEAEATEPEPEPEPVPLLSNTIFTLEERPDGWDDVRGLVRRTESFVVDTKPKFEPARRAAAAVASAPGEIATRWAAAQAEAKAAEEAGVRLVEIARAEARVETAKQEFIAKLEAEAAVLEVGKLKAEVEQALELTQ
eukprot:3125934-Prymnesium_polylepis.1